MGSNDSTLYDLTLLKLSVAFVLVLCVMWQGQPIKEIAEYFTITRVKIELVFSKLADVLATDTPTQLAQGILLSCSTIHFIEDGSSSC